MAAPTVLIVARDTRLAMELFAAFRGQGYETMLVTSFTAGKVRLLDTAVDLVVSELKLDDYNGLHLAIRARCEGVPGIVVGDADAVLEREARQAGAVYISGGPRAARVLAAANELLGGPVSVTSYVPQFPGALTFREEASRRVPGHALAWHAAGGRPN